ncbi:hypothetical protein [Flexivirga caeni]|uniref:Uncharacterized protein n=1 Tax=Flexivirga caeni TaxID=2294115 RepID=A0A3M9MHT0_9MICO|nr:hypothetical protein [Flexivirga caeni]RNI24707.1 hypothetical protein EFY87_03125 [Flexivirga caeni]
MIAADEVACSAALTAPSLTCRYSSAAACSAPTPGAVLYGPEYTRLGCILGTAERNLTGVDGTQFSSERLDALADADVIVLWDNGAKPTAEATTLVAQPLWRRLKAVRKGHVYRTSNPSSYGRGRGVPRPRHRDLHEAAGEPLMPTEAGTAKLADRVPHPVQSRCPTSSIVTR